MSRRNPISSLRSFLYAWARLLGDVQAVAGGPKAMGARIQRRVLGRAASRIIGKMVRR